jgi:hypothetical protein
MRETQKGQRALQAALPAMTEKVWMRIPVTLGYASSGWQRQHPRLDFVYS